MRRYKNYFAQRNTAIIVAVASILFSIALSVGSVYVLLTSGGDGKIGVNVISGECRVDIVDTEDASLVGEVLEFSVGKSRKNVYFEPNATYYTQSFHVKNIGDIPFNFRVAISEEEVAEAESFNDVFECWIARENDLLDPPEPLTEFIGNLAVGQKSEAFYLIIRMKENVGNEFQNKEYAGVGITVYAVQTK